MRHNSDIEWAVAREILRRGRRSSLHCAVASTNPDGSPHVTPIGSVMLTAPLRGIYFEVFTSRLSRNLDHDPRVTVLAVDSSLRYWLAALARGRFRTHPAVRLVGTAGRRRRATAAELHRFRAGTRPFRPLKGHDLLWANVRDVRDLTFEHIEPVRLGRMTSDLLAATPRVTTLRT